MLNPIYESIVTKLSKVQASKYATLYNLEIRKAHETLFPYKKMYIFVGKGQSFIVSDDDLDIINE